MPGNGKNAAIMPGCGPPPHGRRQTARGGGGYTRPVMYGRRYCVKLSPRVAGAPVRVRVREAYACVRAPVRSRIRVRRVSARSTPAPRPARRRGRGAALIQRSRCRPPRRPPRLVPSKAPASPVAPSQALRWVDPTSRRRAWPRRAARRLTVWAPWVGRLLFGRQESLVFCHRPQQQQRASDGADGVGAVPGVIVPTIRGVARLLARYRSGLAAHGRRPLRRFPLGRVAYCIHARLG